MRFVDDDGITMCDPVASLLWLRLVVEEFKEAVVNNLVMDFKEYVDRFGFEFGEEPKEDRHALPCTPFVYVDEYKGEYAPHAYAQGDVVADTCIVGHKDIISVHGEEPGEWGKPHLVFDPCDEYDPYHGDGWMSFRLEYVSKLDSKRGLLPPPMLPDVYLNRKTGEYHWGQYGW